MGRKVDILLVEDSPSDAKLLRHMLSLAKVETRIHLVTDGIDALAFLNQEEKYSDMMRPDLILLDLNMPRMNGFEVLKIIKNDKSLRLIPVLILTTSEAEEDILRCYRDYANSYIHKPTDFAQMRQVVATIDEFWFSTAKLPLKDQYDD